MEIKKIIDDMHIIIKALTILDYILYFSVVLLIILAVSLIYVIKCEPK